MVVLASRDDNRSNEKAIRWHARRGKDADLKKMGTVHLSPYSKKKGTIPFFEE
jgi:hypothetical protein